MDLCESTDLYARLHHDLFIQRSRSREYYANYFIFAYPFQVLGCWGHIFDPIFTKLGTIHPYTMAIYFTTLKSKSFQGQRSRSKVTKVFWRLWRNHSTDFHQIWTGTCVKHSKSFRDLGFAWFWCQGRPEIKGHTIFLACLIWYMCRVWQFKNVTLRWRSSSRSQISSVFMFPS